MLPLWATTFYICDRLVYFHQTWNEHAFNALSITVLFSFLHSHNMTDARTSKAGNTLVTKTN